MDKAKPNRSDVIAAIRTFCDFLDENPEITLPGSFSGPIRIDFESDRYWKDQNYQFTREEHATWFLAQAKIIGGHPVQGDGEHDDTFYLVRELGAGLDLVLSVPVSVLCERIEERIPVETVEIKAHWQCLDVARGLGFRDPKADPDYYTKQTLR